MLEIGNHFKETTVNAELRWEVEVRGLQQKLGCSISKKNIRCRQGICNHRWGTNEVNVICGSVYTHYEKITEITRQERSRIRMARLKWEKNGETHRDVGLIVDERVAAKLKIFFDKQEKLDLEAELIKKGIYPERCDPSVF